MTQLVATQQSPTASAITGQQQPRQPKFQRVVVTTQRRSEPEAPFELRITDDEVKELSRLKKDPAWLARRRLEAWRLYTSTLLPTLNDEAWRRTDIRPFKWYDV